MAWQAVPNAWDNDDWSEKTDALASQTSSWSIDPPKVSKSARIEQHIEENRRIWEQAQDPAALSFLHTTNTGVVPDESVRQVRVLSRNPTQPLVRQTNKALMTTTTPAMESDAEEVEEPVESYQEKSARLAREREEKARKYAEARAKIFGSAEVTPPKGTSLGGGNGVSQSSNSRGRGRGRGGRGRGGQRVQGDREQNNGEQGQSRGGHRGGRGGQRGPSSGSIAPGVNSGKKSGQIQASRAPRNPEAGHRGGFAERRERGGRAAPGGGVSLS